MVAKEKVRELWDIIQESGFNGVVSIEYDGKPLLSEGFGLANFEHHVPNTTKTRFRIASITKQFTAMAILQLFDRGLLNPQDHIKERLPDFPNGDRITVHQLLTHTSGIPNFDLEMDFYDVLHAESVEDALIDLFKDKPLQFEPGTQFAYSVSGFLVLGKIIETISELSYEEYLKQFIFEPLGMGNSGFDHWQRIVEGRANPYEIRDGKIVNADFIDMRIAGAGGGLYSTIEDLQRFNRAIKYGEIISPESVELMFGNQFTIEEGAYCGYGIFLQYDDHFGKKRRRQYHAGGGPGVRSMNIYLPDDHLAITMVSNVNDRETFGRINHEIERILLSEE